MTAETLKVDGLEKGKLYVIEAEEPWVSGNLAEYHSSYPRGCDGEPLHNMIFMDSLGDLEMTIRLSDEIVAAAPEGSQLGETIPRALLEISS